MWCFLTSLNFLPHHSTVERAGNRQRPAAPASVRARAPFAAPGRRPLPRRGRVSATLRQSFPQHLLALLAAKLAQLLFQFRPAIS